MFSVSSSNFDAVAKFMVELVALTRRIFWQRKSFPTSCLCLGTLDEGLTRISDGYDDFIISRSASLFWLKFLRGFVCTHLVFLLFDVTCLENPQSLGRSCEGFCCTRHGGHFLQRKFVTLMCNQVHQEQIVAKETTQNTQVIVQEIPEVQFVDRIQEQSVEITLEDQQ